MATTTITADCGMLGEAELTVRYDISGRNICAINSIHLGKEDVTGMICDDDIDSVIRPHCFDAWREDMACAAESKEEERRESRLLDRLAA